MEAAKFHVTSSVTMVRAKSHSKEFDSSHTVVRRYERRLSVSNDDEFSIHSSESLISDLVQGGTVVLDMLYRH
jgi:hypothetical protein